MLRVVVSDLDYLTSRFIHGSVSEDDLRRDSVILRRLVVGQEKLLAYSWRVVGFPKTPVIPAPSLDKDVKASKHKDTVFASAGDLENLTSGVSITSFPPKHIVRRSIESFKLDQFMESISMVVNGNIISRREVIKYIANKLGGAHYDIKPDGKTEIIRSLDQDMTVEGGPVVRHISLNNVRPVYSEMMSIGRLITQAPDIINLRAKIISYLS